MDNTLKVTPHSEDRLLMKQFIKEGDQYSFERIYHKYKLGLLRFAFSILRNQEKAEEIVHETFLKVYRFKDQYDENKNFKSWLWNICQNSCLDFLRSKGEKIQLSFSEDRELDQIRNEDEEQLEILIKTADQVIVLDAIDELPLTQKIALLLWLEDDLTFEEMGTSLKKSPQAIKNLIHRAKANLKALLEGKL